MRTRSARITRTMVVAVATAIQAVTAAAATGPIAGRWEPLGPHAATVFALEPDPRDPQVVMAGTYFGGLYRSSDYGIHWTHVDTPFSSRMVLAIAFDPLTSGAVYAGTFEDGVYRSTDGGQTWTAASDGLADRNVQAIAVDPNERETLLTATAGAGVYRSTDGGRSWHSVLAVASRTLLFDPRTPGTVLAGTAGQVWRSVDGGQTWSPFGSTVGAQSPSTLIVDPQQPDGYLAATAEAVYRFIPKLGTWQNLRANLPASPIYQIVPFPGSAAWFVVTDDGIFVNTGTPDGPVWTRWAVFDVEPRRLLFTAGGALAHVALRHGALKATLDFGRSWFDAAAGMHNLFVGALATRAVGDDTVLYAGSDLGVDLTAGSFGTSLDLPNWFHAQALDEGVFRIVPHPAQPNVLFAGTERAGVWKSIDWGGSWTQTSTGLLPRELYALSQSAAAPATVYAGTSSGVFRSRDGGRTWRSAADRELHPTDVTAVATDPSSSAVAYVGTGDGQVFRTLDDGEHFFAASDGLPHAAIADLRLSGQTRVARLADGRMFSADGDGRWTAVPTPLPVQAIEVGAAGSGVVFAGTLGGGLFRSTHGGAWLPVNDGLTVPYIFSVTVDPTNPAIAYAGSYLPYRSLDGGTTWAPIQGDLPFGPITSIGVDRQNPATIYVAIQDQGLYRSDDRGGTWALSRSGATRGPMLVDARNGHVLVGERFQGVLRSSDRGANWSPSADGMSVFTRGLAIDPANPQQMYAGSLHGGLYRSVDGGASWALLGLEDKWIEEVAVDPADTRRLYVGSTTGLSRSADGGVTWADIGPPRGATVGLFVLAVAIDPATPSTVYAATGGYGVWKSTNYGTDWTQMSAGVVNPLVLSLVIDASHPATLYAGTAGGGVFVSDDAAQTWEPLGQASNGFITSLAIDPVRPGVIYAGTEGGGVFRFLRQ